MPTYHCFWRYTSTDQKVSRVTDVLSEVRDLVERSHDPRSDVRDVVVIVDGERVDVEQVSKS